nr:MAG TPA: hypothetical protein [Caudoviricetes sp.]
MFRVSPRGQALSLCHLSKPFFNAQRGHCALSRGSIEGFLRLFPRETNKALVFRLISCLVPNLCQIDRDPFDTPKKLRDNQHK